MIQSFILEIPPGCLLVEIRTRVGVELSEGTEKEIEDLAD